MVLSGFRPPQWSPLSFVVLIAALILILGANQVYAQVLYGSLTGSISDESGAFVPGVEVSILDLYTNYSQSATSDGSGDYSLRNVRDGNYQLRASLPGFKELVVERVEVTVGTVSHENLVLRLREINESATVRGTSGLLQTDTEDLHSQLDTRELQDLPLQQFRNYQSLIDLVPGATRGEFSTAMSMHGNSRPHRAVRTWRARQNRKCRVVNTGWWLQFTRESRL